MHARVVETERIEFKAGWNPDPIVRTLCAFANDFENLGGGYLVIGQDSKDGKPVFPPIGVPQEQLDKIQKELLQYCHAIRPLYFPILSTEEFQGRTLVVLWAQGARPGPTKRQRVSPRKKRTTAILSAVMRTRSKPRTVTAAS